MGVAGPDAGGLEELGHGIRVLQNAIAFQVVLKRGVAIPRAKAKGDLAQDLAQRADALTFDVEIFQGNRCVTFTFVLRQRLFRQGSQANDNKRHYCCKTSQKKPVYASKVKKCKPFIIWPLGFKGNSISGIILSPGRTGPNLKPECR